MGVNNWWDRIKSPAFRIERTFTDKLLEAAALVLLIGLWGSAVYFWNVLPERIPVHFDISGNVDGYGSKSTLFAVAIIGTITMILMGISAYNPRLINIPVTVNTPRQYAILVRMARVCNIILGFLFISVLLSMATSAINLNSELIIGVSTVIIALLFIAMIYYIIRIYLARKV